MLNRIIANILPFFPTRFIWLFSRKYIAGESIHDALNVVRDLKQQKITSTIDVLGESISSEQQIRKYQKKYLAAIAKLSKLKLASGFSLKPTMFGLQWNYKLCYESIHEIVSEASKHDIFIRIDMEDSSCTSLELQLFDSLYKEFPSHTGIVLQAYLKRTLSDIDYLGSISIPEFPVNIRLCKGIYIEPSEIAYKNKDEIRLNFIRSLEAILALGLFPAIATHDNVLIQQSIDLINKYQLRYTQYEFQMLLGVTPRLREQVVSEGHRMRIYVPYGEDWQKYSLRRLKENPRMVNDILMSMLVKK